MNLKASWVLTQLASNKALTADRGTGAGVYDSVSDRTFATYAGPNMDPMVMQYDHEAESLTSVQIGAGIPDFHNYPKMIMDKTGHLLVTWTDQSSGLYLAKSPAPRTLDGDWTYSRLNSDSPRYPCICQTSGGRIFIFYRTYITTDYRPLRYVFSDDGGLRWSEPQSAIDSGGMAVNGDPLNMNEVYNDCPRVEPNTGDRAERFALGWTNAGGGPNVVLHNNYHKDVQFAYFDPQSRTFSNVAGEQLGDTIDYEEMKQCLVVNSGEPNPDDKKAVDYYFASSFQQETGYPLLIYNFNRELTAAVWDGTTWTHEIIRVDSPRTLFDLKMRQFGGFRLFHGTGSGVTLYESDSFGSPWTNVGVLSPESGTVGKIITIAHGSPCFEALAMENDKNGNHYSGTNAVFAMGSNDCRFPSFDQEPKEDIGFSLTSIASTKSLSMDRGTGGGVFSKQVRKTFITFAGPDMEPCVLAYDHGIGAVSDRPKPVGTARPHKNNYPKITRTKGGRLGVVWADNDQALQFSRSPRKDSVDGTWTQTVIGTDHGAFPCISTVKNGEIFVFYRSKVSTDYRPLRYRSSVDDGVSWSSPQVAIDTNGQDANNLNEVYNDCPRLEQAHGNTPERFAIAWTKGGGGPVMQSNLYHKNVHFAYFFPGTKRFQTAGGTDLGAEIDQHELDLCIVLDTGALLESNKRIVDYYFATSFQDGSRYPILLYNYDRSIRAAVWNGDDWSHNVVLSEAALVQFDMDKTTTGNFRLFLPTTGVKVFESNDQGRSWSLTHWARLDPGKKANKILSIDEGSPEFQYLATENDKSTDPFTGTNEMWMLSLAGDPTYARDKSELEDTTQCNFLLRVLSFFLKIITLGLIVIDFCP